MLFRGQYTHSLDPKGRVSLPSRIRDVLTAEGDGRYVLTPAPADRCLHLHPLRRWEEYEQAVSKLPRHDRRIVRFRRIYVSAAQEGELDKVGRIRLPPEFRERIDLDGKDVVFAGMGPMVEIWAKPHWAEELEKSQLEAPQILDEMQELMHL